MTTKYLDRLNGQISELNSAIKFMEHDLDGNKFSVEQKAKIKAVLLRRKNELRLLYAKRHEAERSKWDENGFLIREEVNE